MKGFALIFRPGAATGELHKFTEPPTLQFMRDAVGGDLELVPGFDTIEGAGIPRPRMGCVAFCNEHGKLDRPAPLPFNLHATLLWEQALRTRGTGALRNAQGDWVGWLVGPVLVLYGDEEWMGEL